MSPARFGAVNRIAVLAPDWGISTIRPDGSRVVSPGGGGSQQQVAWSPGGRRLAWGRSDRRGGEPARASLVTADPDGGDRVTTVLPTMPFYLWWRPDGRAVACLANGPQGIDLIVAEPGGPARLVGHVDDERLVVVSGDPGGGDAQQLAEAEGFTSPAWLDDGIVADVEGADGRRLLALLDPATGQVRRPLARHDGWARVVAPRSGPRLAVCVGPLDPGRDRSVLVEDGEAIPEALTVVDLASGSLDVVLAYPPVAAEWSPDGRRLLVLVTEPGGPAPTRLRWLVWDGGEARPVGDPFVPTSWWARTELAFAEQFAQSRRTWSPDSRSITYAAQSPGGGSVIVVQSVDVSSDNAPREICRGLAASWSPA
jgi:Tol biopolymer transport system component